MSASFNSEELDLFAKILEQATLTGMQACD